LMSQTSFNSRASLIPQKEPAYEGRQFCKFISGRNDRR
jgi:hypothetical protein